MTVVCMGRAAAWNVRGCPRLVFVEASRGEIDGVPAAVLAKDRTGTLKSRTTPLACELLIASR
jgi:hypothetical protein